MGETIDGIVDVLAMATFGMFGLATLCAGIGVASWGYKYKPNTVDVRDIAADVRDIDIDGDGRPDLVIRRINSDGQSSEQILYNIADGVYSINNVK